MIGKVVRKHRHVLILLSMISEFDRGFAVINL